MSLLCDGLACAMAVQVKKSDMPLGQVQNLLQLCTAYARNEIKFPVFGCVTNMDQFVFVRYDGKEFIASNLMSVNKGTITDGVFDAAQLKPR